ncbi:MAG: phosphoenolpyruvate--protein phosphotransferase [Planctomycetes bacterium]|nr:phosphoenolpyruvate--protein phosphotransferase [Planctomycetota bacterium]
MEILKGIPVSSGIAIEEVFRLSFPKEDKLQRYFSGEDVRTELQRFENAIEETKAEIKGRQGLVPEEIRGVFDFHIAVMSDEKSFLAPVKKLISKRNITPEYAVHKVLTKFREDFQQVADDYFALRLADIQDVEMRLLSTLKQTRSDEVVTIDRRMIVAAHDLTPSQAITLSKEKVAGFVTDVGGATSHTALIARSLGIPAVVGLGNLMNVIVPGDLLIVDAMKGVVIVSPDEATLAKYRQAIKDREKFEIELREELAGTVAVTMDGEVVELHANVEFPEEIAPAITVGATGVGLFRTEFLYTMVGHMPTEEEHYAAYRMSLRALDGKPLVIRSFDFGADKFPEIVGGEREANPFLGCRSIRLSLEETGMFRTQLRAIVRAADEGDIRVMFPMITSIEEITRASYIFADVQNELVASGAVKEKKIPIGMMVEVPGTALMAEKFADYVDFYSIGTNDLTQYTLAVDRGNQRIANLFQPGHPAVLKLIHSVVIAARRKAKLVSCCGEVAGDPRFTLALLGMGLRSLSMPTMSIPEVKKVIRSTTIRGSKLIWRQISEMSSASEIMNFLVARTRKIIPSLAAASV